VYLKKYPLFFFGQRTKKKARKKKNGFQAVDRCSGIDRPHHWRLCSGARYSEQQL